MIIWHVGGGGGGYGKAQDFAEKYRDDVTFIVFEANRAREEVPFADTTISECLGDRVGFVPFYFYERMSCSSLFKINPRHIHEVTGDAALKTWGDHGHIKEIRDVPMCTIDSIPERDVPAPDFLSLDAQGAELKILRGAATTLPSVLAVLAEFQTAEVYQGQGLFYEQGELLHDHGFRLADIIYKEYWKRDGTRLLTSGDALFLNFTAHLTQEQIAKRDKIAEFFGLRGMTQAQIDALEGAP